MNSIDFKMRPTSKKKKIFKKNLMDLGNHFSNLFLMVQGGKRLFKKKYLQLWFM